VAPTSPSIVQTHVVCSVLCTQLEVITAKVHGAVSMQGCPPVQCPCVVIRDRSREQERETEEFTYQNINVEKSRSSFNNKKYSILSIKILPMNHCFYCKFTMQGCMYDRKEERELTSSNDNIGRSTCLISHFAGTGFNH
jgi:hypothetical protein